MLYLFSLVVYITYLSLLSFLDINKYVKMIFVIFGFLLTLYTFVYFAIDQFTNDGFTDSALFHLLHVVDDQTLYNFRFEFVLGIGYLLALGYITFLFFRYKEKVKKIISFKYMNLFLTLFFICGFTIHPFSRDMKVVFQGDPSPDHKFMEHYVGLNSLPETNDTYNLVYLYTESLESVFFDENKFKGLLPELNRIKKSSLVIDGIKQAPMTGWTIAGFVASQCGIPLASDMRERNNSLHWLETFLPKATCIGDVLKQDNYQLTYVGGADLSFAGKGNFLRTHGFHKIFGKNEIQTKYGSKLSESRWGVYDDTIYEEVYDEFKHLVDSNEKFALFTLSLDTHSPHGHIPPKCQNIEYKINKPLLNAIHCQDKLLSSLISRIMAYDEQHNSNTIIVISSDHLMMQNYIGLDEGDPARENSFFAIIPKGINNQVIKRDATTMDIAPTVLSLLGYPVDGFGLGRNLLNIENHTLAEKFGDEAFYREVRAWRKDVWQFW